MTRKNIRSLLMTIALILPLCILIIITLRTLNYERDALKARNTELSETRLSAAANVVTTLISTSGRDEMELARDIFLSQGPEALRYFILSGRAGYALVYEGEKRTFPPDDSDPLLMNKLGGMKEFDGPARQLRKQLGKSERLSSVRLLSIDDNYHFLLRCSRNETEADICIVVDPEKMATELEAALEQARRPLKENIWLVSPRNQFVGSFPDITKNQVSYRALNAPMNGWQLAAINNADVASRTSDFSILIITGVLLAGSVVLGVSLYRASLQKAENAEQRARVTAMLSHELHTPLANLRLYIELIERRASDAESLKRYASVMNEEINRLEDIARNAVELSRGGTEESQKAPGNPDQILETIIERYLPIISSSGCKVRVAPQASKYCLFDTNAWERIIINLLDNARKHAPSSTISISTGLWDNYLRLRVEDDGPGIPDNIQKDIFEPMSRNAKSNVPGFGLGLSVVRLLARKDGGDVRLLSEKNKTVFEVWLQADLCDIQADNNL